MYRAVRRIVPLVRVGLFTNRSFNDKLAHLSSFFCTSDFSSHHSMLFSSSFNSSIRYCKSRDFFSFSRDLHHHHHGINASFDICENKWGIPIEQESQSPPLQEKLREQKSTDNCSTKCLLRSGMVLLKNYISYNDQIKIIEVCRDFGLGTGGFYQPSFKNGSKMHLQMMCFGKNWDPKTRLYERRRSTDGAIAPSIPDEFKDLVEGTMQASHVVIEEAFKEGNAEDILPWMYPDICIVNFYTNSGRLGLHQDKDESTRSLCKGLPVVSFSIGDSAEFLYGNDRDLGKVDKVLLESGDVLLFGGKARHIFHGVSSIIPNSAPKVLVEKANFRLGRLNLTFREY